MRIVVLLGLLLSVAPAALGLEPKEILVVTNSNLSESVALGKEYCTERGVPSDNLVALKLPKDDTITADVYRNDVVAPLRQYLKARKLDGQISCILTVWGVPFRIKEEPYSPTYAVMLNWSEKAIQRTRNEMVRDVELLKLVGTHFPPKAANGTSLERLSDWFDANPPLPEKLPTMEELVQTFNSLLQDRANKLATVTDADKRATMMRQMLALQFDVGGLTGLHEALKVMRPPGAPDLKSIEGRLADLQQRQEAVAKNELNEATAEESEQIRRTSVGLLGVYGMAKPTNEQVKNSTSRAALDSELALLWWDDYPRDGFLRNPLNWHADLARAEIEKSKGKVLMVSRIDGPTLRSAERLIRDAIATEKVGLKGRFYIDAGSNKVPKYDENLRTLAQMVKDGTPFPVVLDENPSLFPPNTCPDAALYVGWYSLQNYIPAFTWAPGAVGYHVASFEAMHLRDPNCNEWVPKMISQGVVGTLGACDEPFVAAFPLPQEFFPLLMSGKVTLAEAYWRTVPHVSWRMMLIGDPLYSPFKAHPAPMRLPVGLLPLRMPARVPAPAPLTSSPAPTAALP